MALIYNTLSYYLEKEKIKGLPVRLREVHNVNSLLSKHRKNSLLYSQLSALFWKQRWHQIPLYRLLCEVLSLSLFPYIFFLERHFINEFTHIRGDLHRCDLCEEVSLVLYKKSLSWKYSNTLNNSQRTLTDPHKNHHRASSFTRIWPNLLHPPSFLPPILPSSLRSSSLPHSTSTSCCDKWNSRHMGPFISTSLSVCTFEKTETFACITGAVWALEWEQ